MRHRGSRGEPDGPEEPGQVGQVGGTGRAGGTGTGRAGNTETSRAGRNRPEQKKPGAENRSGLNRYRQAWLQQLFGQRPYAGRITEPQAASFLNRPHPCPRPRASGSSRAHHQTTGRILPQPAASLHPGRAPQAPAGRIPHRRTPHSRTAEHLTAALPNRRTPPGPTPLTPCACSARARYRCAA